MRCTTGAIVSFAIFLVAVPHLAVAQPGIYFPDGDTLDFGDVGPGVLERVIRVMNAGNEDLHISEATPTCGCTAAILEKQMLAPGDTGFLSLSFSTTNYRAAAASSVFIFSNDPLDPQHKLSLRARVIRDIEAEPRFFPTIERAYIGETFTASLLLKNTSDEAILIEVVAPGRSDSMVVVPQTRREKIGPGMSFNLAVTVTPVVTGMLKSEVIIRTSSMYNPELRLPVYCAAIRRNTGD